MGKIFIVSFPGFAVQPVLVDDPDGEVPLQLLLHDSTVGGLDEECLGLGLGRKVRPRLRDLLRPAQHRHLGGALGRGGIRVLHRSAGGIDWLVG